jgi:hypothetical protein
MPLYSKSAQIKINRQDGTFIEYSAYCEVLTGKVDGVNIETLNERHWLFARTDTKKDFKPVEIQEVDPLDFTAIMTALNESELELLTD